MKTISIGVVGAGRATELHMNALRTVNGFNIRLKTVMARNKDHAEYAQKKYGFETSTTNFDDLLSDDEIDVIDICSPPYTHVEMIKKIIKSGKHVICEKPLHGYFENDTDTASKEKMYKKIKSDLKDIERVINKSDRLFMYAENFVYAPSIQKSAELISSKKSRILYAKGEESLKGSSSPVAGSWSKTGGGSLIRVGAHPLAAILYLKQIESKSQNKKITLEKITSDVGTVTPTLSEYEHRHIAAKPIDVEDMATLLLSFSDGSKGCVIATDTLLGGSKNYVELYCNDCAIECKLTMNDLMKTYYLDEDNLENEYFSEMLPSKMGWNNIFISDEIIRGYSNEMQDFMECIAEGRKPKSGFELARDTIIAIYAAYYSSETGKAVKLR